MKKTKEIIKNEDDTTTSIETVITTPEDGFVHESDVRSVGVNSYGKYHKGYSINKSFTIDDSNFKRKFVFLFCLLFFITGFAMLIVSVFIGVPILIFSSWLLYVCMRDIKRVESEQKLKSYTESELKKEENNKENNI